MEVKMNIWIIAAIIAGLLIVATVAVLNVTANEIKTVCKNCGTGCTAEKNCGSASCGAISGGTCNCNKG
jgi:hypothetical protein